MGILVALIGVAIIAAVVVSEVSSEENWKTKKNKKRWL